MYKANVILNGLAPLRFNKFNEEQSAGKQSDKELQADAELRTYRNAQGALYIPAHAIEECIYNGGKKVKLGRSFMGRILKAVLFVMPKEVIVTGEAPGLYSTMVRIPPKSGGRVKKSWVWVNLPWKLSLK